MSEMNVKLQRILSMPPAELACRGRQQLSKLIERITPKGEQNPPCRLDHLDPEQELQSIRAQLERGQIDVAGRRLLERFTRLAPTRFFAGAGDDELARCLVAANTLHRQQTIAAADALCRGEFPILGYGRLSFGIPVNWHLDAVSGQASPALHWSRINPLETARVGDSKVVWELNRHQWLLELGQAYRYTGDERYAETFARYLREWMQANPLGVGINWSSSLEVAMRLMAWCWALFLFRGAAALTSELFLDMLGWMQAHANFVERYLSYFFSPNTHLTAEALGLYYAGTLLREVAGARAWRELGSRVLVEQMAQQVHADGVYFEQSTRYQYYTVEIYLHFLILAQRNADPVDPKVPRLLEKMVDFLLSVRWPDGSMPRIGDADGGWLMPFWRRSPDDYRALFSTAALLYRNAGFAWAAGELAPESLWLLGKSAQRDWAMLLVSPPSRERVRSFDQGGYVVMRSSWHHNANQLIFDTGPLGCRVSGGHGHADLLSIQCSAFGQPVIIDAGTFCYAEPRWRNYFRGSMAHNTVLVDGHAQAMPRGPFSWHSRPAARAGRVLQKPQLTVCEATHHAYHGLVDPVSHRRRVVCVDNAYWLLIDDLSGNAVHGVDLRLQCAALPVDVEGNDWVRVRGSGSALLVKAMSTAALHRTIAEGELDPPAGWISPDYGQRVAAPALCYQARAGLPLRIVTVLYPVADPGEPPPTVNAVVEGGQLTGLTVAASTMRHITISDDEIDLNSVE